MKGWLIGALDGQKRNCLAAVIQEIKKILTSASLEGAAVDCVERH